MKTIRKTLNKKQLQKIISDLRFLKQLLVFAQQNKFRVVVSGGYALDGVLGEITRHHNDIDISLYGKVSRTKAIKMLNIFIRQTIPDSKIKEIKISQGLYFVDFYVNSKGLGVNLYFIETANNPFKDIHTIKKMNGEIQTSNKMIFLPPIKAKLLNLAFEARDPNFQLADIINKRKRGEKLLKHNQDIENLRLITDENTVKRISSMM